ncbi:MAG: hypothetical protein JWN14_3426 [Chthonomonadales bacterium]|nr:hypothetical protein [Chthonomonadales bacterium]
MKNTKIVGCDSVGCRMPAGWVHSAEATGPRRDFLCHECWEKLLQTHPEQAGEYMVYHIYTTPSSRSAFSKGR